MIEIINKYKKQIGTIALLLLIIILLLCYFFFEKDLPFNKWKSWLQFSCVLLFIIGFSSIFNLNQILFDNQEYKSNESLKSLVRKIRFRAVLFNNISIILFLMIISIILVSFYLIFKPLTIKTIKITDIYDVLSVRIAATVLLKYYFASLSIYYV